MLFFALGVVSVLLGFSTAIYVVFEKFDSRVTGLSVFITAALGIVFSVISGLVVILAIWPPVTMLSWLIFAAFAIGVSFLVLTGNKSRKESDNNIETIDSRADLRSNTGS